MERYRAAAQAAVPEETVLAVGVLGLTAPATMPGFPPQVLMAITPSRLIAFEIRPRGGSIKVKSRVAAWDHDHVQVRLGTRAARQEISLETTDGSVITL